MGFIPAGKLINGLNLAVSGAAIKYSAAQKVIDTTSGYMNSLSDFQSSAAALMESSAQSKDTFMKSMAQSGVHKMLGDATLSKKQEELLKQLLDPKFENFSELFERIRYSFVPTTLPSGEKFVLPRVDKNNIVKAAQRWDVPIGKKCDTITGIVAKKAFSGGEECFMSGITRQLEKGVTESSAIRFYPKSGELSVIKVDTDRIKTIQRILGTEDGGKVIQEASFKLK